MNKMKFLIICLCFTILCGCEFGNDSSVGWIVDDGAPTGVSSAIDGDFYLDSSSYNLYQMENESWKLLGNISGEKGEKGKDSSVSVSDDGFLIVNGKKTDTKIVGSDGKDGEAGKAGKDGSSPKVTIDTNGYIMIDNIKLNIKRYNSSCKLIEDYDEDGQLDVGDYVTCGSESFYVIRNDGTTVSMMAKWNLDVGYIYNGSTSEITPIENPTGLQSEKAKGLVDYEGIRYGVVPFTTESYWDNGLIRGVYGDAYPGYVYDSNSTIFNYLQEYKKKLKDMGVMVEKIRVPDLHEVRTLGCFRRYSLCDGSVFPWLITSSYWTGSADNYSCIWGVIINTYFTYYDASLGDSLGVRPVIEVLDENILR